MRTTCATLLLAGLCLCVSAPAQAQGYTPPEVVMSVTAPDGTLKQLTAPESGLATLTLNGRTYGFRPTMHDDSGQRMTVTVFDLGGPGETARELGALDIRGTGPAVTLKGSPAFKVQARKAAGTTPKTT